MLMLRLRVLDDRRDESTSVENYITDRLISIIYELENVIKAESRATDTHMSQHWLTPLLRLFQRRQLDHLYETTNYRERARLKKKFVLTIMINLMMSSQGRDFHQFLIDNGVTEEQVHLLMKQPENLSKLELALDHIIELKTLVTDQTIPLDVIFTLEDEQLEVLLQDINSDASQEILTNIGYEPPTLS
jgi:hypothetical protein